LHGAGRAAADIMSRSHGGTMSYEGFSHDRLMIRKKVFSFLGQKFHIYAPDGTLVFFTRQKAFRLKEDIRVAVDPGKGHAGLWHDL
jgi:hypothetical protein